MSFPYPQNSTFLDCLHDDHRSRRAFRRGAGLYVQRSANAGGDGGRWALPGVCDRLPDNPLVLSSGVLLAESYIVPEIGSYGGELLMTWQNNVVMKETLFNTQNRDDNTLAPNIIEEFTIGDDAREYTFKLRAGHKWSDGAPVTTEDVRFAYDRCHSNEELRPSIPGYLRTGGNVPAGAPAATLESCGRYDLQASFLKDPILDSRQFGEPRHRLPRRHQAEAVPGPFHIDYGDADEINAAVEAEGLAGWFELFNQKDVVTAGRRTTWQAHRLPAVGTLGPRRRSGRRSGNSAQSR